MSPPVNCGVCSKKIHSNINCSLCKKYFHVKCSKTTTKEFNAFQERNFAWFCPDCCIQAFPFATLENHEFRKAISEDFPPKILPHKKSKCGGCAKRVSRNAQEIYFHCFSCEQFYHKMCSKSNTTNSQFKKWECPKCTLAALPFSKVNDNDLLVSIQGFDENNSEFLSNVPSFNLQSLLDQLPGQQFSVDSFLNDSIESKYYTPAQFISAKIKKNRFSIIHLNISSLKAHLDELKTLLKLLDHPFDVICLTETRIRTEEPLFNVQIDGYQFFSTPTLTQCGGAGIYVKTGLDPSKIKEFSISEHNVSESIFVEITGPTKKKFIIGCIYRHHTPVSKFLDSFFIKTVQKITQKNKNCILAGDFNIDLIKFGQTACVDSFYDLVSAHGFRPLILQPTRVGSKSATLIDNIFINDISCFSTGGNITHSISDHFLQFAQIDIFEKFTAPKNSVKFARNWRYFNKNEFEEELSKLNWAEVYNPNSGTDQCLKNFLDKIERLTDEMAPLKKLTKKEIGLCNRPWITNEILKSMAERDSLYKEFTVEKDQTKKNELYTSYKQLRNAVISILSELAKNVTMRIILLITKITLGKHGMA